LGKKSPHWKAKAHKPLELPRVSREPGLLSAKTRRTVGIDLFIESKLFSPELGASLKELAQGTSLDLKMMSNRGTQVWPGEYPRIDLIDHYRCRFMQRNAEGSLTDAQIHELIAKVGAKHMWMHVEKLQEFDGQAAFAKAQGED